MNRLLKVLFFALLVKPLVLLGLGLNTRQRNLLPQSGPAIIAANHNSHLDTLVLMSLYPLHQIHRVRPVAAADYFLSSRFLAWFSLKVIGIIPLERKHVRELDKLFNQSVSALEHGDILVLFPEGTRGQPEQLAPLKKGIYHLAKRLDSVPITPVIMRGLGMALPRGEALFIPYNCDVIIGKALSEYRDADGLLAQLSERFTELETHCLTKSSFEEHRS
ncbi:lysophospholipid acyltransferase family protein [Aliagarivorans marinus]|uniref:lysophospholipid acyltransferase family protein n=1 Tax=Aliagarivorans marinus TaxID=561965 RepID=UPI00041D86B1|nr:lysophospholipid acyltransferase family protein [Aliagarivorans marinus]